MKILRQKPEDAQTERFLITSFIVSENICRQLHNAFKPEYFQSEMTKEIAKWCFDFFEQYNEAIQKEIETTFEMKAKAGVIEPALEEEIRKFLIDLSSQYEEWETLNEQFYVDLGFKYFNKRSYLILSESLKEAALEGNVQEAANRFSNFIQIQQTLTTARDIMSIEAVDDLKKSLENQPPALFTMPGALGQMIGPIERETFIGILGGEKTGKTYHLMMFAVAAMKRGLKVAMIETGDLTQNQLDLRFYSRFTGKTSRDRNVGLRNIPIPDCVLNQTGECEHSTVHSPILSKNEENGRYFYTVNIKDKDTLLQHTPCIECYKDLDTRFTKFQGSVWWQQQQIDKWNWHEAKKAVHKFQRRYKGKLITEAFPMRSIKASDIRRWVINKQKNEGWVPDVLIIDYPDILLPEGNGESRHQENEKWMILRSISQEFHNCVIVSTQADSKSYNRDSLSLDNFSEDKRKYSHVTHFFAINKNKYEPMFGCSRFGALLLREDDLQITQQVTLLQNLSICQPCAFSFFGRMPSVKQ